MKIYLDRSKCTSWIAACETCFSWHYLGEEIIPNYCLLETEDDGRPERTFFIRDAENRDLVLEVNIDNWADAYDSWLQAWQAQQKSEPQFA